jgi:FKBP-type peptidyl-prolyl cis-trans isomerase (trigger factor)
VRDFRGFTMGFNISPVRKLLQQIKYKMQKFTILNTFKLIHPISIMPTIKNNDFVEIDFTGTCNGELFDTTNPKDAEKLTNNSQDIKPLTISVGNEMLLRGLDEDLEGKETEKEYIFYQKKHSALEILL